MIHIHWTTVLSIVVGLLTAGGALKILSQTGDYLFFMAGARQGSPVLFTFAPHRGTSSAIYSADATGQKEAA